MDWTCSLTRVPVCLLQPTARPVLSFPPCLCPCCPSPPSCCQVIAQTHEELVKKIEDVKQEAVAKIQAPAVSDLTDT